MHLSKKIVFWTLTCSNILLLTLGFASTSTHYNNLIFQKYNNGLPASNLIWSSNLMYEDKYHNLWNGNSIGLYEKPKDSKFFRQIVISGNGIDESQEKNVSAILLDNDDNLWVGVHNDPRNSAPNGLYVRFHDSTQFTLVDSIGNFAINNLALAHDHTLYAGAAYTNNVYSWNVSNENINFIPTPNWPLPWDASGGIDNIFIDNHTNEVFIITHVGVYSKLDEENAWIKANGIESYNNTHVCAQINSNNNEIWFAIDTHVYYKKATETTFTQLNWVNAQYSISAIGIDKKDNIWFSTYSNLSDLKLYIIYRDENLFRNVDIQYLNPNNSPYLNHSKGVSEDSYGNIWLPIKAPKTSNISNMYFYKNTPEEKSSQNIIFIAISIICGLFIILFIAFILFFYKNNIWINIKNSKKY